MFELDAVHYHTLFDRYKSSEFFFPLIGAVLLGRQDGIIYVDNLDSPEQIYVEHAFGFAQIFGKVVCEFESKLEHYLLRNRCFTASKVRLYATYLPEFLDKPEYDAMRSLRQRFFINTESLIRVNLMGGGVKSGSVDENNVAEVENVFGVVSRFWRSSDDFIHKSNAVVVYYGNQLVGICYAAAEADHCAEIDVLTLPEFRNLGVGRLAVTQFVEHCFGQSLQPLWDCFANNAGSMNLSRAVGFFPVNESYPFFTINKHSQ